MTLFMTTMERQEEEENKYPNTSRDSNPRPPGRHSIRLATATTLPWPADLNLGLPIAWHLFVTTIYVTTKQAFISSKNWQNLAKLDETQTADSFSLKIYPFAS